MSLLLVSGTDDFWGYLFALLICEESSVSPLSLIPCSGFVSCKNKSMSSCAYSAEQKVYVFRKIFENQILPCTDLVKINSMCVSLVGKIKPLKNKGSTKN